MTIPSYTVEEMKAHRQALHEQRIRTFQTETIPLLEAQGFRVRKLSDYQYRVNARLDLYPVHRRFHYHGDPRNRKGKRGGYRDALVVSQSFFTPSKSA